MVRCNKERILFFVFRVYIFVGEEVFMINIVYLYGIFFVFFNNVIVLRICFVYDVIIVLVVMMVIEF